MSENTKSTENADMKDEDLSLMENQNLPKPNKKKGKWKISLIWLVPLIAFLIAISLAIKAYLNIGPTIEVSFRSAEGLVAGKTSVQFRQVNVGLVRKVKLSSDLSHVIAQIELTRDARNFASTDSKFWVVRPRIGTNGVSGIDTLFSGAYIEVEGGKANDKKTEFTGLESPPVIPSDVPGKTFFLNANDLGSLYVGAPIYYRKINVGQIAGYKLTNNGKQVELQAFIKSPYDKFVTKNARFWQASGVDVSLNASGFNLQTQSLSSIVAGGIAFGYPINDPTAPVALDKTLFTLHDTKSEALKRPDGKGYPIIMYFDQSLRGLSVGAPIDFMGINVGEVTAINAEFSDNHKHLTMRVDAMIYPSRLASGSELDPHGAIFKSFVQNGLRAQIRSGSILTGQNYIAFSQFPKAQPKSVKEQLNGKVQVPTMPPELSNIQAQVSVIADKLSKFPLNEIGTDVRKTLNSLNNTINSTKKLMDQLDGKVAPDMQQTLDELRKTLRSSESILSSDSVLQQDVRRTVQQVSRAAASVQLMADYIEQHPESLIRGKKSETKK